MLRARATRLEVALFLVASLLVLGMTLDSSAVGSACWGGSPDWTGTSAGDTKTATGPFSNYWDGANGDDDLDTGADFDQLCGGTGGDRLVGGGDHDDMLGEGGADRMWGDELDDLMGGNDGNDDLHGGGGADYLTGHDDNDELWGDDAIDHLFGKRDRGEPRRARRSRRRVRHGQLLWGRRRARPDHQLQSLGFQERSIL